MYKNTNKMANIIKMLILIVYTCKYIDEYEERELLNKCDLEAE